MSDTDTGAPPETWESKGLCAQTDPEAFFPEKGGSTKEAKKICQGCEVRDECLQAALERDERYGIWGGYSERERRRIKRGEHVEPAQVPFDPSQYTNADGHGYRGYKKGCKCGVCKAGYRKYHRDYALRSGNQIRRHCQVCGDILRGSGRVNYCTDTCKQIAKEQRAQARKEDVAA